MKKTALLSSSLQRELLTLLEVAFHPQGGDWAISDASRAIVTCSPMRR
jgi:hypothetical protein